ncbi:hypothetical protein HXX76_012290 [Chlamydomonas incerta]|uniref:Glycosyl transferase CAP10 domain-containing protein n=1 Tax=Chlamydomonas incerta TaxID=51695 RepID=A0A835SSU9_CHLIN|nr:hypothetical protein HXX76_012290 [Chlamydomonas incerta]|eukprot:KAG2427639.1 hypothetical protein HXX76_012290 [Chlamydomonas incerta]
MKWDASDLPFLDHAVGQDVLVLPLPRPGYEAAGDEEWAAFLRQNLGKDLAKYGNATASIVTLAALHTLMARLWRSSAKRNGALVVLRRGRAHVASHRGMPGYIRTRLTTNLEGLMRGARRLGLQLPDTLFAYNAQDEPVCRLLEGACSEAPLFSHIKRYDWARGRAIDSDVLIPHMLHAFNTTIHFPWAAKDPRALLRARLQSSMDARSCMRVCLANLSASPAGAGLLDAGFVENRHRAYRPPAEHMKGYLTIADHARYRLLLNADGHTASSRLGYLLTINSPVLTQHSLWIEYYYRSLNGPDPGSSSGRVVSYYNESTILDLVRQYQADAAQHFAAKYITPDQKVRYWVAAVQAYAALMPPELKRLVADLGGLSSAGGGSGSELRMGTASGSAILDALKAAGRGESGRSGDLRKLGTTGSKASKSKSKSSKGKGRSKGAKSSGRSTRRKLGVEVVVEAVARWWTGDHR